MQAARGSAADPSARTVNHVDVLVVAALPEELEAARDAASADHPGGPGVAQWEQRDVDGSSPYVWGEYRIDGKLRFTVALARPTYMGGRTTGPFVTRLVDRLRPTAVAMCGVCAGNPARTALGDVVVGELVYEWDEGKHSASGFAGDHRQFSMDPRWVRAAQDFDPTRLTSYGEADEQEASLWFLEQLHRGEQPRDHLALKRYFPSGTWLPGLARLEEQGLIRREPTGEAVLTSDGSHHVQRRLYDDVDGPRQLPYRVLVAPMASGSAVMADPDIWGRLAAMGVRKIAAIEMEAATVATVAHERGLRWIVAKGVMDHADSGKDDRYKNFAARASAQVMFALLEGLVTTTAVTTEHPSKPLIVEPTTEPMSAEQRNAVRSATSYLETAPFSRTGLIRQLASDSGDGYSLEAATYAVDALDIDYHEQATKAAKNYLSLMGFSRKKLIEQLSDLGDGYSLEAATRAVDALDIDYHEQATKAAKNYLSLMGFSRKKLIEQLSLGDGFTPSEAAHGANEAGV